MCKIIIYAVTFDTVCNFNHCLLTWITQCIYSKFNVFVSKAAFLLAFLGPCHTFRRFKQPKQQLSAKSTLNNVIIKMSARSEQTPGRGDDSIKFNIYPVDLQ